MYVISATSAMDATAATSGDIWEIFGGYLEDGGNECILVLIDVEC